MKHKKKQEKRFMKTLSVFLFYNVSVFYHLLWFKNVNNLFYPVSCLNECVLLCLKLQFPECTPNVAKIVFPADLMVENNIKADSDRKSFFF